MHQLQIFSPLALVSSLHSCQCHSNELSISMTSVAMALLYHTMASSDAMYGGASRDAAGQARVMDHA